MILLALPVYQSISAPTYNTVLNLFRKYPDAEQRFLAGCPWIDLARADLMALFLSSSADHMLFIDSDVAFDPRVVDDLLATDLPVVSAPYREKMPPQSWTCYPEAGITDFTQVPQRLAGGRRVLRMARAGLGCTLVRRDAADTLFRHYRESLQYRSRITQLESVAVFATILRPDAEGVVRPFTEDAAFFIRLAECGIPCDVLWDAQVMHGGIVSNMATVVPADVTDASKLS